MLIALMALAAAPAERAHSARETSAATTLAALRHRFGAEGYQYEIDSDARLVYAAAMDAAALARLRSALNDQSEALHAELFEHKPEAFVKVLLPTAKDYGRLVRFRNVPGVYIDSTKSLIARE